ncbi:hypothetical protein [Phytoactinopolyspora mesophila]|uniref:Uncharacterized protein n=1 Tax=Phytoactinopolyspora mesophila TaxID=2650750 RepID=A0A7K3M4C6_9ACTN|nr:hypothetical protein [Phytoactinopolyspora mesophila]NDL58171.1 hypothetical protein [Phytoactinopolyspora mesophila]
MMQGSDPARPEVDPMVLDAVKTVRDRFGAVGLRHLVTLARDELARVEQAEAQLGSIDQTDPVVEPTAGPLDVADTQAWLAYTEQDPEEGEQGRS